MCDKMITLIYDTNMFNLYNNNDNTTYLST